MTPGSPQLDLTGDAPNYEINVLNDLSELLSIVVPTTQRSSSGITTGEQRAVSLANRASSVLAPSPGNSIPRVFSSESSSASLNSGVSSLINDNGIKSDAGTYVSNALTDTAMRGNELENDNLVSVAMSANENENLSWSVPVRSRAPAFAFRYEIADNLRRDIVDHIGQTTTNVNDQVKIQKQNSASYEHEFSEIATISDEKSVITNSLSDTRTLVNDVQGVLGSLKLTGTGTPVAFISDIIYSFDSTGKAEATIEHTNAPFNSGGAADLVQESSTKTYSIVNFGLFKD